jgi:hypothetical protein
LSNLGQGSNGNTLEYKIPRTYQYTLGFQRQLPKKMVIDFGFAGNFAGYTTTTAHDLGFPPRRRRTGSAAGLDRRPLHLQHAAHESVLRSSPQHHRPRYRNHRHPIELVAEVAAVGWNR